MYIYVTTDIIPAVNVPPIFILTNYVLEYLDK